MTFFRLFFLYCIFKLFEIKGPSGISIQCRFGKESNCSFLFLLFILVSINLFSRNIFILYVYKFVFLLKNETKKK